jgi:hypothetical protein
MERGHLGGQSLDDIRAVAAALDMRIDLVARWRAGDLDRLLNGGHSALHESVARMFRDKVPGWVLAPEVSFAIYGERGVIDILAWHPGRRALLVIELKTDLADMNEVAGTFDRKRRLARQIALERGWDPLTVSAWLIVVDGRRIGGGSGRTRRCCAGRSPMTVGRWLVGCGIRLGWSRPFRSGPLRRPRGRGRDRPVGSGLGARRQPAFLPNSLGETRGPTFRPGRASVERGVGPRTARSGPNP